MQCPVCEEKNFERVGLPSGLQALHCTECGGHWINSFQYWLWKDKQSKIVPESLVPSALVAQDILKPKECPECGRFLYRYDVGRETNFSIERCEHCRGIWFDKNELEILHDKNLHDEVHFVFSQPWQRRVRKEHTQQVKENALRRLIGVGSVQKVKEFKKWFITQKEQSTIIAFLIDS